jgi:hypothetical protein
MPRYVLLEHVAAPDDPAGIHYDLILEDGDACRTWRLSAIPRASGEACDAREIVRHRRAWLDAVEGEVSGGRGRIRRIAGGECEQCAAGSLWFQSGPLAGRLVFEGDVCRIVS